MDNLNDTLNTIGFKITPGMVHYYEYLNYGFYITGNNYYLTIIDSYNCVKKVAIYHKKDVDKMIHFLQNKFPLNFRKNKIKLLLSQ